MYRDFRLETDSLHFMNYFVSKINIQSYLSNSVRRKKINPEAN